MNAQQGWPVSGLVNIKCLISDESIPLDHATPSLFPLCLVSVSSIPHSRVPTSWEFGNKRLKQGTEETENGINKVRQFESARLPRLNLGRRHFCIFPAGDGSQSTGSRSATLW